MSIYIFKYNEADSQTEGLTMVAPQNTAWATLWLHECPDSSFSSQSDIIDMYWKMGEYIYFKNAHNNIRGNKAAVKAMKTGDYIIIGL